MEVRPASSPVEVAAMTTEQLRDRFIVGGLFQPGRIRTVYTHEDRMVVGGVVPVAGSPLTLPSWEPLRSAAFCEHRELGIVAIGESGRIEVDGVGFDLAHHDVLYVGRGARDVVFHGDASCAYYL